MTKSKLSVLLIAFVGMVFSATAIRAFLSTRGATDSAAFRSVNALLSIREQQGWTVVSAPVGGNRYRICGATESDPKNSMPTFAGQFGTDTRSVSFQVSVPNGHVVAVEGLAPENGSALTYAVFSRPITQGASKD